MEITQGSSFSVRALIVSLRRNDSAMRSVMSIRSTLRRKVVCALGGPPQAVSTIRRNHGWTRMNTDGLSMRENSHHNFLSVFIRVHPWFPIRTSLILHLVLVLPHDRAGADVR